MWFVGGYEIQLGQFKVLYHIYTAKSKRGTNKKYCQETDKSYISSFIEIYDSC